MIKPPTLNNLRQLSDNYNLKVNDNELKIYSANIEQQLKAFNLLSSWENPLHLDKSKYEGRKAHRATTPENPYNAWYHKVNIVGNPDPSKLLHGYKVGIKDNIAIATIPLMNGSKILEGYVPEYDATVVTRILDNGGTIVGNATCENLCLSGSSYNTTYGPVKNPWNTEYSAGGSSSGSAVVVAVGDADLSLGADQGGSIRIPAASCGIVGLKPTHGLVPYTGIIPIESTLDHVGPMARTVVDCARLLTAIAGFDDGKDHRQPSCGFNVPNYVEEIKSVKPGTLRIGILKEGFNKIDQEIVNCVNHAVQLIKESGKFATIEYVSIPDHDKGLIPFWVLFGGFLNQCIDSYGYGTGCSGFLSSSLVEKFSQGFKDHIHTLHPTAKVAILSASYIKHQDKTAYFSNYAKGQSWGWILKQAYDKVLKNFDVLLMPTLPHLPSKIPSPDATINEPIIIRNTAPFDLTHHPAITVNAGYDNNTGLPIGLQLVGRLWDEATVLKAAALIEEVLKPLQRPFPK